MSLPNRAARRYRGACGSDDAGPMTRPQVAADTIRDRAIKRLKKRRDLGAHALVFLLVNSFIVAIWFVTNDGGFFWPIFPIGGWGIGLVMNAYDVYRGDDLDEERIEREIRRLRDQ